MTDRAQAEPVGGGAGLDPGREGVVPFEFSCHRCGHCCTGGEGYVWLAEGEAESMAAALDMTAEAFRERHVRRRRNGRIGRRRHRIHVWVHAHDLHGSYVTRESTGRVLRSEEEERRSAAIGRRRRRVTYSTVRR